MSNPMVSICNLVYNHEKWLRRCLDGFVMQKTSFKFEVLSHDDASTDSSATIIREYEERYPDIFCPIYQTENQYSKGQGIFIPILLPKARGKYIALCEGDDYWCDPLKLQKCFENIRDELMKKNADDSRIGAAAYRLLHEAMIQLPENPLPEPLTLARNFIDNHFQDVHLMTREQIAKAACVSVSTLSSLFREYLDSTIWQTICSKRMESVKQLLTYSNKSIGEISQECGFSYPYYLAREFKKQFGMTPLEYRKHSRNL